MPIITPEVVAILVLYRYKDKTIYLFLYSIK